MSSNWKNSDRVVSIEYQLLNPDGSEGSYLFCIKCSKVFVFFIEPFPMVVFNWYLINLLNWINQREK